MVKIIHHPPNNSMTHEVANGQNVFEDQGGENTSSSSSLPPSYSPIAPTDASEVYDVMVDKLLANLGVIADLQEGDKLWYTSDGSLLIQNPGWFSTSMRTVFRINRWNQQDHLYTIIKNALKLINTRFGETIKDALRRVLNGLRNLSMTYQGDSPIVNRISVLSNHIRKHVNIIDTETFETIA